MPQGDSLKVRQDGFETRAGFVAFGRDVLKRRTESSLAVLTEIVLADLEAVTKRRQEQHALLIQEFNQYLFEHPQFLQDLPEKAVIVLQLKGDEEYNRWSREVAGKVKDEDQPLAFIEIQEIAPLRSRLVEPQLRLTTA